ncbi:MAG: hypothetical protein AAB863_03935, partial [Patescibacteria group bacterium]
FNLNTTMKISKLFIKILSFAVTATIFGMPALIFAQGGNPPPIDIKITNPLKGGTDSIPVLLEKIISEALLPIGAVVVVVMIIYAGFLFVTAKGKPEDITKAKDALLYAAIGAGILLGARVLAGAIKATVIQIGG